MLIRMNNEAKVRQSTWSVVLGKAKVMRFEDIEVPRAARAAKEVIKSKGKRGRKRKSAAPEADESESNEPEQEVAHATKVVINGKREHGQKRKSAVQEADEPEPDLAQMIKAPEPWRAQEPEPEQELARMIKASEPWRAPVARMYKSADCGELDRWKKNGNSSGYR